MGHRILYLVNFIGMKSRGVLRSNSIIEKKTAE